MAETEFLMTRAKVGEHGEEVWDAPMFDGLDNMNDKKWRVVQTAFADFRQWIADNDLGGPDLFERFLAAGFFEMTQLTQASVGDLRHIMGVPEDIDMEPYTKLISTDGSDPKRTFLIAAHGTARQLFKETTQGQQLAKDHPEMYLLDTKEMSQEGATLAEMWNFPDEDKAKFSKDGMWASAVSMDGRVILFPCDSGEESPGCVRCCQVNRAGCTDMDIDWKNMFTLTTGLDGKALVCDLEQDKLIGSIRKEGGSSYDFSCDADFSTGKFTLGGADSMVKVGDLETLKVTAQMRGHRDSVYSVHADWDHNVVVSGAWDYNVGIFDARAGKMVATLQGHNYIINRMRVDFEKQLAISVAWSPEMILWDLRQRCILREYFTTSAGARDVSVDWENQVFATCDEEGWIKVHDMDTGGVTQAIEVYEYPDFRYLQCIDVDWKRQLALVGCSEHKLELFDLVTGNVVKTFKKFRRVITRCKLKPAE